uniref:Uncharacterized protein n=1 Tax=Romanomermis culicivorax TaxID=13658 RepID=A0A915LAH6_ROMCU
MGDGLEDESLNDFCGIRPRPYPPTVGAPSPLPVYINIEINVDRSEKNRLKIFCQYFCFEKHFFVPLAKIFLATLCQLEQMSSPCTEKY